MASSAYRKKAFDHHGEECQECGTADDLHVHHKDRDRSNNDLGNLVVLCQEHHWDRHREEFAERSSGPRKGYQEPTGQKNGGTTDDGTFLRDVDWAIISVLREGRANAPLIAEKTDYSAQYIRERLGRLKQDDIVIPLGHGIYEVNESEIPVEGDE